MTRRWHTLLTRFQGHWDSKFGESVEHFIVPAIAVAIMVVFAMYYGREIAVERQSLERRLAWLRTAAVSDAAATAPLRRRSESTENRVDEPHEQAQVLWNEWQPTLLRPVRDDIVYRTLDAEEIFTPERLFPGVSKFRGIAVAPSIFTGLGVLFTFIGLAAGFLGLDLSPDGATTDGIIQSAGRLVHAAGIAFAASIFGVILSLSFNLVEKDVERRSVRDIEQFQRLVNERYPLLTPEHSLVQIADSQTASTEALQELHERIGNRLQEALDQQATAMRTELSASIQEALAPAVMTLVNATASQSSVVFENLVERFAASFTDLGAQQRAAMDASSERLQSAISELGDQVRAVTDELAAQSKEVHEQQKLVIDTLHAMTSALTDSTENLEGAATSLIAISDRFETTSTSLSSNLSQAATMLDAAVTTLEAQAAIGARLTTATTTLAEQVTDASGKISHASTSISDRVAAFGEVQDRFRNDLSQSASSLAEELNTHVHKLSEKVAAWLSDYSADVERQIEGRMEKWNSVSQDYAAMMLATAQALSDAIEELPARSPANEALQVTR